jgi:hypothetical protein
LVCCIKKNLATVVQVFTILSRRALKAYEVGFPSTIAQ